MQEAELVLLWLCEKSDCEYKVTNGLTDVKEILLAMSNHLAAMHPASGGSEGGGGGCTSNAAIPMLEEGITEMAWAARRARYDRWAVACKLSDKTLRTECSNASQMHWRQTCNLSRMHGYYQCKIFIFGVNFCSEHMVFRQKKCFCRILRSFSQTFSCPQVYLG